MMQLFGLKLLYSCGAPLYPHTTWPMLRTRYTALSQLPRVLDTGLS